MKKLLLITSAILALSSSNVMAADTTNNKETIGQRIDDAKIVTVVNADLVKDQELSAIKINVDSTQGNVVLRGTAPNPAARDRASSIAKSVKGVVSVDNQLTLAEAKPSTYDTAKNSVSQTAHEVDTSAKNTAHKVGSKIDDAAINMAVNSGLAGDSELSALKINVDVKNGHVWLKGTAPNSTAKSRATDIAKKVDGVTTVTNQLVVSSK